MTTRSKSARLLSTRQRQYTITPEVQRIKQKSKPKPKLDEKMVWKMESSCNKLVHKYKELLDLLKAYDASKALAEEYVRKSRRKQNHTPVDAFGYMKVLNDYTILNQQIENTKKAIFNIKCNLKIFDFENEYNLT